MRNVIKNLNNFPVIINEYGWLWLNRDGSPTTLTRKLYENLLGPNSSATQRRYLRATYLAALTEFWRCHRQAAGVMCFTALSYCRKDGQTCDFFTDPAKLEYDSALLRYLPDAFSPVGIMLNEWGDVISLGEAHNFNIIAINDLGKKWNGVLELRILKNYEIIKKKSVKLTIKPYGKKWVTIPCVAPLVQGVYEVVSVLETKGGKPIRSVRKIPFK